MINILFHKTFIDEAAIAEEMKDFINEDVEEEEEAEEGSESEKKRKNDSDEDEDDDQLDDDDYDLIDDNLGIKVNRKVHIKSILFYKLNCLQTHFYFQGTKYMNGKFNHFLNLRSLITKHQNTCALQCQFLFRSFYSYTDHSVCSIINILK